MVRSRARPILITASNVQSELERIRLGAGVFDEKWLQELIHVHPSILPISDIEPGFGDLIAAAREVPCGHGFIDNLYLTPSGDIVLVETKLWRNSQMRREVVAQTLDYVAALGAMSFEAFESTVSQGQQGAKRLYELVRDHPEALAEPDFIDAVALNLRRGRMLAIALGDGIRAETELLGSLLQGNAGLHFTFALVEVEIWKSPVGELLAVPSTLARTVMIERGIVRIEDGIPVVRPIPQEAQSGPQSLTSTDFWEAIAQRNPAWPIAIRSFLKALEPLGLYPDIKASLNLKLDLADRERPPNFGYIAKNGQFWANPAAWTLPERVWRPYFSALASIVGGTVIDNPGSKYVAVDGRSAPRVDRLLPGHEEDFVSAIKLAVQALADQDGGS